MAILESRTQTGISWVKESIALFKMAPGRWIFLAMAYVFIFMMLPSVPGLSLLALLTVVIWPVFVAFAVLLFRNAELGKQQTALQVFNLIQPKLKELMLLGLTCLVYATLTTYLLNADIQSVVSITEGKEEISQSEMALLMDKLWPLLLKLMLLLLPLFLATWFSPMLIAFNHYSLVKAIKSSIAGMLQYTIAMGAAWLMLSAGVVLVMLVVGIVIGAVGAMIPLLAQALMPILVFGTLLVSTALMFAFQYVSYRDVFRAATVETSS